MRGPRYRLQFRYTVYIKNFFFLFKIILATNGQFHGVTDLSKMVHQSQSDDTIGPIRDTRKSTVAAKGKEKIEEKNFTSNPYF